MTADPRNSPSDWYDAEGRLCAVYNLTSHVLDQYLYDAGGARYAKGTLGSLPAAGATCAAPTISGSKLTNSLGLALTSRYLVDPGGEQVTELAESGSESWTHTNIWVATRLTATYDGHGLHFELADPLGTKRVQANTGGIVENWYASLPYGDDLTAIANPNCTAAVYCYTEDTTEHHYTGKERDTESGNDYFFARYYSSAIGRFLSPDWSAKADPVPYAKLDDPQTLNLYGYLRNNPLGGVDADGHCGSGPNDPPCNQVKVAATVEQKPKFTKNVPLKDKDGNVVKGPNGKPVEKDTGIHGTLGGTVTVNGKPAAGVKLTESNAQTTVIDGTNTNPHVREGEGTSPNGQYKDDIGYGFATSGKADNANIINQLSTEKLTITDTQTLTMTFPSGGTCSATSTRVLTNVGSDGNPSSHYTLTTTQPVVTPNQ